MDNEYVNELETLFFNEKSDFLYELVSGYKCENKNICVFFNKLNKRNVHVYMKNGILYPFFPTDKYETN